MKHDEIKNRLLAAMKEVELKDVVLLKNNLSERCISSRLAFYLQSAFPEHSVDLEYNRKGESPKRLNLPVQCANDRDDGGDPLVVPDIIVHKRGPEGPNILVVELKKTTNRESRECDHLRIHAFREQLGYEAAATIECETRPDREATLLISEWI
jgi:hypothetical protein